MDKIHPNEVEASLQPKPSARSAARPMNEHTTLFTIFAAFALVGISAFGMSVSKNSRRPFCPAAGSRSLNSTTASQSYSSTLDP